MLILPIIISREPIFRFKLRAWRHIHT